jgi:beta-lactamase class D
MWLLPFLVSFTTLTAQPDVGPGECFILSPLPRGAETVLGGAECDRRTLPASTFKIPHALIALETGVITAETVMKWDRSAQDFAVWQQDFSLEGAIQSSVLWFFQRAARAIGSDRERQYLKAFSYGSMTFSREVDRFWLNGDLTISPREQIAFLKRMFTFELPVDRRHIDSVRAAMTMPRGTLSNAAGVHDFPLAWRGDVVARLKTGNGTVAGERASWLIGELERNGRAYVFASRVTSKTRTLGTTAAADLAVRQLNRLQQP